MCTVTYLPLNGHNFILTSNRDEQRSRITIPPKKYCEDTIEMLYPKDKVAGGTWIGISNKNRLVCILNGALIKHKRVLPYTKSRGLIAKELLASNNLFDCIEKLELNGVEPFTMVLVDWNNNPPELFELIWDANTKHFNALENKPKIWSSSTLYADEIKAKRQNWFNEWISLNEFNSPNILKFHHSEIGDKSQSILMKRPYVETVSITSVSKINSAIEMYYEDVVNSKYWINKF